MTTCHHSGITGHIRPKCPQLQARKKAQRKLPTKTTSGTLPSTGHQVPWHQRQQQRSVSKNTSRHYKKNRKSPIATMPMKGCWACYKGYWGYWTVWAIPDHIYHRYTCVGLERMRPFTPWGGVDSPSIGAVSPCLGFWFLNPSAYQVCLHCIDCHILYILFLPCILFEEPPFLSLDFLLVALRIFYRYILGMTEKACHCFSVLI